MPDVLTTFRPFTLSHLIALAWTLPLIVASCWYGRRQLRRGQPGGERQLCAMWAGAVVVINLWSLVYWFLPENFDIRVSLPLQLCDIAALLAPLVLLGSWRWPRTLVHFWGIGLSTQAFVTPTLVDGIGQQRYWLFWLIHLAIVGTAVYDVVVRGYRPRGRDLVLAIGVSLAWVIAMFGLNILLGAGSNYGYVANTTPENPTVIDALGPWPWRVGVLVAIAIAIFTLMWGFWLVVDRLMGSRSRGGSES